MVSQHCVNCGGIHDNSTPTISPFPTCTALPPTLCLNCGHAGHDAQYCAEYQWRTQTFFSTALAIAATNDANNANANIGSSAPAGHMFNAYAPETAPGMALNLSAGMSNAATVQSNRLTTPGEPATTSDPKQKRIRSRRSHQIIGTRGQPLPPIGLLPHRPGVLEGRVVKRKHSTRSGKAVHRGGQLHSRGVNNPWVDNKQQDDYLYDAPANEPEEAKRVRYEKPNALADEADCKNRELEKAQEELLVGFSSLDLRASNYEE